MTSVLPGSRAPPTGYFLEEPNIKTTKYTGR